MENSEKQIDAFDSVFEEKLKRIKINLKKLLEVKDRKKRDKKAIKSLIQEAKTLRKILKTKTKKCCPHCGGVL